MHLPLLALGRGEAYGSKVFPTMQQRNWRMSQAPKAPAVARTPQMPYVRWQAACMARTAWWSSGTQKAHHVWILRPPSTRARR
eukprot:9118111-Alexandrium_andersonii.AAC.1